MKVLICDDEETRFDEVREQLTDSEAELEVEKLVGEALTAELTRLFDRVDRCLQNPDGYDPGEQLAFDAVDLAIFDNNLAHLRTTGARLTAEAVLGYVRAFTSVPYVVSLNKNPDVDFDLRYLMGDYETRADLALNTEHLSTSALWTGDRASPVEVFVPWYWPTLMTSPARRRDQTAFVRTQLDGSVLRGLEFPLDPDSLASLSAHARGALSPVAEADARSDEDDGKPIEDITFYEVFEASNRSLPIKDERVLLGGCRETNSAVRDIISRVVAADVDRWFRRDLLGPQQMLVDVPHLLTRFPFLLGNEAGKLEAWNATVGNMTPPHGLDGGLYATFLYPTRFKYAMWVPTPSFWWPLLKRDDKLNELFFATVEPSWPDVVFCEDRSRFIERVAAEGEGPVEFSTDFEGSWARRHVARVDGVQYAPLSRLLV